MSFIKYNRKKIFFESLIDIFIYFNYEHDKK